MNRICFAAMVLLARWAVAQPLTVSELAWPTVLNGSGTSFLTPTNGQLLLWLSADYGTFTNVGCVGNPPNGSQIQCWTPTNATTWGDHYGNLPNGFCPVYVSNSLNSLPTLNCPISQFTANVGGIPPYTSVQPVTIIALVKFTISGSESYFFGSISNGNQAIPPYCGLGSVSGTAAMKLGANVISGGSFTTNAWHIFVGEFNGASSVVMVDGVIQASGDIGSTDLDAGATHTPGASTMFVGSTDQNSLGRFQGNIAAIQWLSGVASSNDIYQTCVGLTNKWGL